jgi:hypothetical protein
MAQVNVVVPAKHADLVRRVGKGLRDGEEFADALRRFLDGEAGIPVAQRRSLAEQVADAVVAAVTPMLAAAGGTTPAASPRKPASRKRPGGSIRHGPLTPWRPRPGPLPWRTPPQRPCRHTHLSLG